MKLVDGVLKGDRLLLARLLTEVENDTATGQKALDMLFPYTGKATLVGVTGAPGTGKSSLVNSLATAYRHPRPGSFPKRVAIVAVDPSIVTLGSRVYVPEYGVGLAGDTGSAIRSRRIDLGYDDENLVMWYRWVDVYLLDAPPARGQIHWVLPDWPRER